MSIWVEFLDNTFTMHIYATNHIFPVLVSACHPTTYLSYIGLNTFRKIYFLRKYAKNMNRKKFHNCHLHMNPYHCHGKKQSKIAHFYPIFWAIEDTTVITLLKTYLRSFLHNKMNKK